MSVDILTEHQAPAELRDEAGSEDMVEHDVSMVVHDGLDDITFDTDDGYVGYSASDEAVKAPTTSFDPELDQEPGHEPSHESPSPLDAPQDHEDTAGADLLGLENAAEEQNGTPADPVISHTAVSEADAAESLNDHEPRSGSQAPRSPIATQHSAPEDGDLVSEVDYEANEGDNEIFLEELQPSEQTRETEEGDNEGAYRDGEEQSPGKSADLEHAVSNPESINGQTHTMPPNEESNGPVGQPGGADDFDLDANGHGDYADPNDVGSDPDAEGALAPDNADQSAPDHEQEHLLSEAEQEEDHDDGDNVEYMDVAEADDQSSEEFSTRPHVRIRYRDTAYSLFSTSKSDDPYSFFFSDLEALEHPLSQFLAGLREVLSDEVTSDEELVIRVDGLGLEFAETMDKSALDRVTFGAIINLHDRLVKGDNPDSQDAVLLVYLVTRPNAMRRLDSLLDGASIGEGLSAYRISYPDYLLIDFPPRDDSKETTAGSTPRTSNGNGDADFESDLDANEDHEPDKIQEAGRGSPQHTDAASDWRGSESGADQDEDLLGDSYDQVIDEAHERTSADSNNSASRHSSPNGSGHHESGSGPVGRQQADALAYEGAQSEVKDTHSTRGSERADPYLNPTTALGEADEETEPTYETLEPRVGSDEQELGRIDDLITEELEASNKDEAESDAAAGDPSYTADGERGLGAWEDGEHDTGIVAGEGSLASPTQDVEIEASREADDEDWDVDNALETAAAEDHPFEMLRRQSAADTANAASLEQSSASATLDGEEIDLEEVLATAGPTDEDERLGDDIKNLLEGPPETDEIDWDDNENEDVVVDAITSTPSSNTGKRARDVDDTEGSGDGHDVKRHRA